MDVADIVALVDDHGFADIASVTKVDFINAAIRDICDLEPWPFLNKSATLNFNGSSATPTNMPADFGHVRFLQWVATRAPIRPQEREEMLWNSLDLSLVGVPTFYYFDGTTLKLWPIPASGTGTVLMDYGALQADVTASSVEADILIPPRFHDLIWISTLINLYLKDDDPEMALAYQGLLDRKLQRARASIWRQQVQEHPVVKWIDVDDYDNELY